MAGTGGCGEPGVASRGQGCWAGGRAPSGGIWGRCGNPRGRWTTPQGWEPLEGARGAGRGADAQSCWKTRVRLPGEGGARQALYPSENPRARRGGRNHPKWRGQAGPCHPSKVAAPTPPRRRCPWTPALFPREVNLNWSYRGSWLEN